jgi:transcriptional regulator with XRE-family HTH domain
VSTSLHNDAYLELVGFLIEIRRAAGLTQQQLGDVLGKPQSYVSKIERRERRIDVIEFTTWVRATDIEPPAAYSELLKRLSREA